MDLLKSKAQKYNSQNSQVGKKNALLAIKEFKEIETDRKMMVQMAKDKWHPLPEVAEKEIIFDRPQDEPQEQK